MATEFEPVDEFNLTRLKLDMERSIKHQTELKADLKSAVQEFRVEFKSIKDALVDFKIDTIQKVNDVEKRVSNHRHVAIALLTVAVPLLGGVLWFLSSKI